MASSLCASSAAAHDLQRPLVMQAKLLRAGDREARLGRVLLDHRGGRQPTAGEDLVHDEFEEPQVPHRDRHAALFELLGAGLDDRVQQHHAVGGQHAVSHLEERVVAVEAEVLERADRHDAVHGFVELLPALQKHPFGARTRRAVEQLLDVGLLVLRQGEPDDVHVVLLDRAHQRRAPAAADVEQRHVRLQAQLAQRQVDLGDLSLLKRHVVALEVRAAVGLRGVQEQPIEVVGQVVVVLDVLEMGRQSLRVRLFGQCRSCSAPT